MIKLNGLIAKFNPLKLMLLLFLSLLTIQSVASVYTCKLALQKNLKIFIGSELGYGDASEPSKFVTLDLFVAGRDADLQINLKAEMSDSPAIRVENKGGIIGETFVDPKRSIDTPNFLRKVRTVQYQDSLQPSVSLLNKMAKNLPGLLGDFLQSAAATGTPAEFHDEIAKILEVLSNKIPIIELRSRDDEMFRQLPNDRLAATQIGVKGAPIFFQKELMSWGRFNIIEFNNIEFGPSAMGKLLEKDRDKLNQPATVEFIPDPSKIGRSTEHNEMLSYLRILIHELGHQIGLLDHGKITPDMVAASIQKYLEQQTMQYRFQLQDKEHSWINVLHFMPKTNYWEGALLVLDSNGARDLNPEIQKWVRQAFPDLSMSRSWLANVRLRSSSPWDIFSLSSPMILNAELMIEKEPSPANLESSMVKRDIEIILFYGAENSVAAENFNKSSWTTEGPAPELISGPSHESLVQMRLLPVGTADLRKYNVRATSRWPEIKVKPKEPWRLFLETLELPKDLEPVTAHFNIRPKELRHNVWFREEEPIQIPGHWESIGGRILLHGLFQPSKEIKPGIYVVESIIGEFRKAGQEKLVKLEIKTSDRLSVEVVSEPDSNIGSSSENPRLGESNILELKRFGTIMVKVINREDQLRWIPLHANVELTMKLPNSPSAQKQRVAGWVPVPFVFNRPFNPKSLWLHGTAIVIDRAGKEFAFLFSGPLEQLGNIARLKRIYQNKLGETVLDLSIHHPLTYNGFEFKRWSFAGMTVVEDNLDVSYQRLHFTFGRDHTNDKSGHY
jgi:hypothetical protein